MPGPYMHVNGCTYGSPRKYSVYQNMSKVLEHWTAKEYSDYRAWLMRRMRFELFEDVFKEHDLDRLLIVYGKSSESDFFTGNVKVTLTATIWEKEI